MIINSNDSSQRNILTNKCYYQTTAQIMHDFEQKGYVNSAISQKSQVQITNINNLLLNKKALIVSEPHT